MHKKIRVIKLKIFCIVLTTLHCNNFLLLLQKKKFQSSASPSLSHFKNPKASPAGSNSGSPVISTPKNRKIAHSPAGVKPGTPSTKVVYLFLYLLI